MLSAITKKPAIARNTNWRWRVVARAMLLVSQANPS